MHAALFGLLTGVAAQSGCYSFMVAGRAHTVGRGHLELYAVPGVSAVAVVGADANLKPRIELGARYGVSEAVDLGLRVGDSGASLTTRVSIVRRPTDTLGFELLLAPGIQYTYRDKLALELPVVLGLRIPGGHELLLAPRLAWQGAFDAVAGLGHPAQFVFVGGSLAFAWQVSRSVALIPEIGLLANVYSEPGYSSFTAPGPALQAALGLAWDK